MAVGGDAGTKLKSTSGWIDYDKDESGNGTDSFGFSARPAGQYDGDYNDEGRIAHFWSSMECDDSYYAHYMLVSTYRYAYMNYSPKYFGLSVRCLKD